MYDQGRGVPQNDAEAVNWWRKAAEQGLANAQHNIGISYAQGQGVPQNYVNAYMWFNLAAAQGDQGAVKARDMTAQRMTPGQIAEAEQHAREMKFTCAHVEAKSGAITI
jgi:hypothetical protein